MLPVARSVSPPRIVRDDSQDLGPFAHIFRTMLRIHRFVTDCTTHRHSPHDPSGSIPLDTMKQGYLVLSGASSHHTAEQVIYSPEKCRIRSHLHAYDQFRLVVNLRCSRTVHNQGGVPRLYPPAVPAITRSFGRTFRRKNILLYRRSEKQVR